MKNAPVYYVLGQVGFNPIPAMAKYVDEIQDKLRRDYPLFEKRQLAQLQFSQEQAEPQVAHTLSWLMTKADRTCGFILNPASILFHTTHYNTSDDFIPNLLNGLRAVHEVAELNHINKLGLRYLDAVLPREGETVDHYLCEKLHGITFGAHARYSLNESVFETTSGPLLSKGTLIARVYRANAPLGFPPDILPHGLLPMSKFGFGNPVSHAVIDTDHFVEGAMPVNFEKAKEQMLDLHSTIKSAFEATITPHAKKTWA